MTRNDAYQYATMKLREHGLFDKGWRFNWNRRKRALGLCDYRKKSVELSEIQFQIITGEKAKDTILHEIAHALAGHNAKHGPVWKAWCRQVGANPERAYRPSSDEMVQMAHVAKYRITCSKCRGEWPANRKRKHSMALYICPTCNISGTLTMRYN